MTSYAEVVLAPPVADALHPAFGKLFVQTEILRGRAGDAVHAAAALGRRAGAVDVPPDGGRTGAERRRRSRYETDRARFIGRGRTPRRRRRSASRRAVEQRGLGARPGRRRSAAASRSTPDQAVTVDIVYGVADERAKPAWRWPRSTRTGASPTACSSWPGRTARSCCASSTRARPMRSCTAAWPAR